MFSRKLGGFFDPQLGHSDDFPGLSGTSWKRWGPGGGKPRGRQRLVGMDFIKLRQVLEVSGRNKYHNPKNTKRVNSSFHLETWKEDMFSGSFCLFFFWGYIYVPTFPTYPTFRSRPGNAAGNADLWGVKNWGRGKPGWGGGRLGICKKNHTSKIPRWRLNFKDSFK